MSQYSFNLTFSAIDSILDLSEWDTEIDSPTPEIAQIDCTPENWYTQYWSNCVSKHLCADLNGYEFREICDYTFYDDETIYTGHFLDLYLDDDLVGLQYASSRVPPGRAPNHRRSRLTRTSSGTSKPISMGPDHGMTAKAGRE